MWNSMFIPFFTKLAASLQAKNNKKYIQLLTRLYGGKNFMYDKLRNLPGYNRGIFHGTSLDAAEKIDKTGLKPFDGYYGKGVYLGDKAKASQPSYFRGAMYKLKGPNQMTQEGQEYISPRIVFSKHDYKGTPKDTNIHKSLIRRENTKLNQKRKELFPIQSMRTNMNALDDFLNNNPGSFEKIISGKGALEYDNLRKSHPSLKNIEDYSELTKHLDKLSPSSRADYNTTHHYLRYSVNLPAWDAARNVHINTLKKMQFKGIKVLDKKDLMKDKYFGTHIPGKGKFNDQREPYEINIPKKVPIEHLQRFI